MIRRPPRSTLDRSSAASDVYKRQMLIVEDLKGVLEAWRNSHPGREPSAAEKLAAVAHYVENDAYLPQPAAGEPLQPPSV